MPTAPGRLSTMNGWPKAVFNWFASVRARMSVLPPAAHGTITCALGLSRYAACTGAAAAIAAATPAVKNVRRTAKASTPQR